MALDGGGDREHGDWGEPDAAVKVKVSRRARPAEKREEADWEPWG